jgi:rubrerythrin
MKNTDMKTLMETLGLLAVSERTIEGLYSECAKTGSDPEFWSMLAAQEDRHAENLEEMARLIAACLGVGFALSREFPIAAIRTFIKSVTAVTARVQAGLVRGNQLYHMAHGIEQALIEQRYGELVRTSDLAYSELMNEIATQTETHNRILKEKIAGLNG